MDIFGVIPARSGSKGIKNKNIQKISGQTLLEILIKKFKLLKKKKLLKDFIASTDSKIYSYMAKSSGSKVQIRPDLYNFNGCIFIRHNILINKTNIIITV